MPVGGSVGSFSHPTLPVVQQGVATWLTNLKQQ